MSAWILTRSEPVREGLQPFDPQQDLRQVAELVSAVFTDELDASGRNALQEMRLVGRFSPFLGGMLSMAFFEDFVSGYVWVERGKVVGNVTLQRADPNGMRWRISNVAVKPEYRRRGIARSLMAAALREIAVRGGSWAVLQVRSDNPGAHRLYEDLGFSDVCQDGIWKLPVLADPPPPRDRAVTLHRLDRAFPGLTGNTPGLSWIDRFDLAQAARTPLAQWASPLHPSDYQFDILRLLGESLGSLTEIARVERWGATDGTRLIGAVEARGSILGATHALRFAVRPEARGKVETALVAQGLSSLARLPRRPVLAEHSGDHLEGVTALEAAGFRAQRVLMTMRRQAKPGDVELWPEAH